MPTTTLGLDVMVGETGWARHAPDPLLLVGELAPDRCELSNNAVELRTSRGLTVQFALG